MSGEISRVRVNVVTEDVSFSLERGQRDYGSFGAGSSDASDDSDRSCSSFNSDRIDDESDIEEAEGYAEFDPEDDAVASVRTACLRCFGCVCVASFATGLAAGFVFGVKSLGVGGPGDQNISNVALQVFS